MHDMAIVPTDHADEIAEMVILVLELEIVHGLVIGTRIILKVVQSNLYTLLLIQCHDTIMAHS